MKTLTKHLCEIRFKPDPKILDKRGEITGALSDVTFPNWKIANNRIDFGNNKDLFAAAFFSYRNLGTSSCFPHNSKYFVDITKEFIKKSWIFFPNNNTMRVGVRSSVLVDLSKNFKDYFEAYKKNISVFTKKNLFKAELVDVGLNLNFANGDEYFNITTGPMEREQTKIFFDENPDEDLPNTCVYVEVDYFKKDFKPSVKQKDIFKIIDDGISKSEEISSSITSIILGKE
ncbi:MAG: hypothetical protein Q7S48_00440 [bacterium]|nr:hypothetical protein [bacterium]